MDIFRYRHHTATHTFTFMHIHTQDGGTCPESVWNMLKRKPEDQDRRRREKEREATATTDPLSSTFEYLRKKP